MDRELFDKGLATRREVLGDAHVDRAMAAGDTFTKPLQDLLVEFGWGTIWSSDGLPRKTRSMLNIVMLTALNRPHELKLHLHGALRNGVSSDEIREILLQTAVYIGVPAALDSFRVARAVLDEADKNES